MAVQSIDLFDTVIGCCEAPVADFSIAPCYLDRPMLTAPQQEQDVLDTMPDLVHTFQLTGEESDMHMRTLQEVAHEPGVEALMDSLLFVGDMRTWAHCWRTGSLMVATSIKLNMTEPEAKIAARMGLLHDVGKSHPAVQQAIHTPRRIDDELRAVINTHPWHGVVMAQHQSQSGNVLQGIGNHHGYQTERPKYGVFSEIVALPEADGKRPDLETIISLGACCDIYDALTGDPVTGGRAYQRDGQELYNRDRAVACVDTIAASDNVKSALLAVTR